jgi:predicted nucleic acid-binding protein
MSDSIFVDTNVLIYAIETHGPNRSKSRVALSVVRRPDVCLSTQVLGEFYRAVTSPRRERALPHNDAVSWVQLWKRFDVRTITVAHVDLALELVGRFRLNYFDALILAAARLAGCRKVFSEDMNAGQDYAGVCVENPFENASE